MLAILLFLLIPFVGMGGVFVVKFSDQHSRDRNRKTYKLAFPSDLDGERVAAWIRSLSGTLASKGNLGGVPTIAFEVWASQRGIEHRIKVPWTHADYVVGQLRSLVPGIRVSPEDEWPSRTNWTRAVEVGLSNSSRQLRIYSSADLSASILAAMQALEANETLMVQWVVTPAPPKHLPIHREAKTHDLTRHLLMQGSLATKDEVTDRREKLSEPNMLAVLRVAAIAATPIRGDHLIFKVKAALSSARGPATKWTRRFVGMKKLQQRIAFATAPVLFPMQLSAPELTALVAWPIGNPFVSGLPAPLSRHLPAPESVPVVGRHIGRSNFPGSERAIAVSYEDARKHMHITGPTGVGKTVLLANMMKQDIEHGYGVVLIENKGDLFHSALDYIPPERLGDVVVLDVSDVGRPVGFNILNQGNSRVVVDELTMLFEHLYPEARGVWTREVLYHGLQTLTTDPKLTFIDLAPLLMPMSPDEEKWRDDIIRGVKDQELRNFWTRLQSQPKSAQERIVAPVMDRIWQLNSRPELRNIIGQSDSAFQMADLVRQNKILLVNLAGLPRDSASLTGTLIMNSLWHAVKTVRPEKPTYLYLDEFQDFLNLPVDPEDMLAKARGFGLGMVLAHQHLQQLPTEMRQAVLSNARTKVVFQTSANDATTMSREFGQSVDDTDFMRLGRYEAIARVATGEGVSPPITLSTSAPAKGYGRGKHLVYISRNEYGKPVQEVENSIVSRRNPERASGRAERPRPKVAGDWD
jgi:hypothetical protein